MNPVLGLIGLARKGGKIAMGEEPTSTACRMCKACAVFTASDAAANSVKRASNFAELCGVGVFKLNATKEELGAACGRSSLAMFAVEEPGLALAVAERLSDCDEQSLEYLKEAVAFAAKKRKTRKKK